MHPNMSSPRHLFPKSKFGEPANSEHLENIEAELGVKLPEQLRELYLDCDGFREDRGNAKYLLSLTDEDKIGSLVKTTKFYWEEWPEYQPKLNFRPFVFFGSSSADEVWGIDWKTGTEILSYHHHMEDEYEVVGTTISEVWIEDYARYVTNA